MPLDIYDQLPYTTGNSSTGGNVSYRLSFLDQQWMLEAIMAALVTLTDVDNWNEVGTVSPDEAVSLAISAVETFNPMVVLTGAILPFAGTIATVPTNSLLCDGASYLRADYPELFAVIGTVWGSVDADHFNVPDMRGRTAVGAGTGSGLSTRTLAQQFGEESHTLDQGEMPSHSHSVGNSITILAVVPGEGPVLAPNPIPAATGNTGGSGSHNNMQPTTITHYIVVAKGG